MTQADPDLAFMSAKDVRDAICGGKVTALEVFEVISRRIELLETDLNSYCTLDLDRARDLARLADQQLARGDEVGPLHGVPVAIKEDLPVEGLSWTFGSRLRAGMVADRDGLVVARLRRAGAIILGKTNEPEFGHKGTTDNLLFGTTSKSLEPHANRRGVEWWLWRSGGSRTGLPRPGDGHRWVNQDSSQLLRNCRAQTIIRAGPSHPGWECLFPTRCGPSGQDRVGCRACTLGYCRSPRGGPVLPTEFGSDWGTSRRSIRRVSNWLVYQPDGGADRSGSFRGHWAGSGLARWGNRDSGRDRRGDPESPAGSAVCHLQVSQRRRHRFGVGEPFRGGARRTFTQFCDVHFRRF